MTIKNTSFYLVVSILLLMVWNCNDTPSLSATDEIDDLKHNFDFESISSSKSNINFSNTIKPEMSTMANLFDYDYFYNGAGVGVVDINNDGLQDIFFCGNQVDNKLYLNKGNFVFEDISKSANINAGKKWSTGVTFGDINNDGNMDIYVSQGGPFKELNRKNLLFINNGDLTFQESAEEYGLADPGISTQSSFADFDGDGDLDCVVMNEAELYGYEIIPFYEKVNFNKQTKYYNTSHIYENVNGKFIDKTEFSALDQPSFGLGLVVADLNEDNLLDIYIANDYFIPDAMYINKGNFEFEDQIKNRAGQVSFFGMGLDVADLNNDAKEDIFVLDMAAKDHYRAKTLMASMNVSFFDLLTNKIGFVHQYMYNSLQLNDGTGSYNNIAQLAGISSTDWSWTGLLEDYNNDSYRDIYVTNGYRKYALDNDFKQKIKDAKIKYQGNIPLDIKQTLYDQIPEEKVSNILFQNNGDLTFDNATTSSGLDIPSFSNGGVTADLDNDGDLDLVVNNIDEKAFVLKNNSNSNSNWIQVECIGNTSETFARVSIQYADQTQSHEIKRTRGYMSAPQALAHFGLGSHTLVSTVTVEWKDGTIDVLENIDSNQKLRIKKNSNPDDKISPNTHSLFNKTSLGAHKLTFKHNEDAYNDFAKETLLPHKQSTDGPSLKVFDINKDGLDDLFVGGAIGQSPRIYIQEPNGKFDKSRLTLTSSNFEDTDASIIDIDNDGDNDLIITSGGNSSNDPKSYSNRLLINNSGILAEELIPSNVDGPTSKVLVNDFDQDGDSDVIIANRIIPQQYPLALESDILINSNGKLSSAAKSQIPELADLGIINDIIATDINGDSWIDIIAVGDWTGINVLINRKDKYELKNTQLNSTIGWWNKIQETDIDNDGDSDYIIGNVGLNTKYKASEDKPLKIFAEDFDKNGSLDIVLSKKYKDEYVPFRGKECSSEQMPFVSEKFPTYDLFAKASIEDVYGNLDDVYHKEANTFESVLLINDGKGNFKLKPLPKLAQVLPIKDMVSIDLNDDGFEDVICIGNIYNTEVETPRMDFNSSVILFSDQKGGYEAKTGNTLGMKITGNAKSIEKIKIGNKNYVIIGINDGLLNMFEIN